jgi:hypothetical protein
MLAVAHSELLLHDHCISRHFKFKTYNCWSIYQRYQPLYLPNIIFLTLCFELFFNLRGKIEKILYYTRFISHFVALVCFYGTRRCAPRQWRLVRGGRYGSADPEIYLKRTQFKTVHLYFFFKQVSSFISL